VADPQDNQAELDKIMGRPSNFKPDPAPAPAPAHDINKPATLGDHLRGIMGTVGSPEKDFRAGPKGQGVMDAVNEAVASAPKTPEE